MLHHNYRRHARCPVAGPRPREQTDAAVFVCCLARGATHRPPAAAPRAGQIEAEAAGSDGRTSLDAFRDRFDLAVEIIDRRRELHLSQEQVAAASGLNQSVVSRIEQGVANPTARTLAVLARALDARITLTTR